MRIRIARISLGFYVALLLLGGFLLAVPGNSWPWFVVMGLFALPSVVLGPGWYRVAGICGVVLTVLLIHRDREAGAEFRQKMDRIRDASETVVSTNSEPVYGNDEP